jgi:hypothetical protein
VLEAAWWWCGVCSGDEDAFNSIIGPRASIGDPRPNRRLCAPLTLLQSATLLHPLPYWSAT